MNSTESIIIKDNFLTEEECSYFINLGINNGFETAPLNSQINSQIRNNERYMFDDKKLAEKLFEKIKPHIIHNIGSSVACGLNERFKVYRYNVGQEFKKHKDGNFKRNFNERSIYTVLIYLNQYMIGGETELEEIKVKPETGRLLLFRHELIHAGCPIISGVKYVLRTDLMYRDKIG
jgi:prolyl 4-hydroxylase